MSIKDRLLQYTKLKRLSVREFERICGLSFGTAARLTGTSNPATFRKIEANCDLNTDWLIKGEGNMLKPVVVNHVDQSQNEGGLNAGRDLILGMDAQKLIEEEEQKICDLEREVAHLKDLLAERDRLIAQAKITEDSLKDMINTQREIIGLLKAK